ncbi:FAD/FMN-containing dehydrogenase [Variovorax sp. CF079]|uniref:D-2-hydroxyglutarate dehydrogenase YdiJ n=1 Tax=Variovorax sp. CF079 TaxID=1882774 RepID=UPI000883E508|nr:FAD-binding and (Fe-S)-binding domain-containing protein [Variovorax sp. CF079]SDE93926.1 FAD/FMN-containing dehydrogenase [Variovorax sp. CF079]
MIPRLKPQDRPAALYSDFLSELRLRGFEGDVTQSRADRTVFATDNSIYQVPPQAVVFPRNELDVIRVAKLANEPRFKEVSFSPRGGGTGTNGQSLTSGIAVDVSRHMNKILEINPAEGWARVQAGVVKDQLNDAVREHGLFFAPELSPSNRATIGGMIATDASGQGSVLYGKTRDHVLELKTVLLDGTPWHSRPLSAKEFDGVKRREDRVGAIHRLLDRIRVDDAELIAERFPKLNRCVTGYDLVHLCDHCGNFNLSSVLCGAEGSLAFVTEAKINLVPIPHCTALVNIRYSSFDAALRDAGTLMKLEAASSETVDAKVLALAREDAVWLAVKQYFPDDPEGPAQGVNLVEFLAEDEAALAEKLARVEAELLSPSGGAGRRGYTVARGEAAASAIWSMRKKSVGLLGNMLGERRPVPFVEDTVVPPERLADYIAEFRAALDRRGLVYGMFGHVDAGCLHVRPALDMKDPDQEKLIREISDEVFALTRKYQGVLWGEHGKGFRSEYAPEFFGPLYPRLQEIKAAFDPHNQLNPGKIAAPPGHSLTRIDDVPTRGQSDRRIPLTIRHANEDSLHCNGNAACFNYDPDDAMCPSWKATRDRKHSPKGRASLMREWLRLLADADVDSSRETQRIRRQSMWKGWIDLPSRALNSWTARSDRSDFSLEVKEAMDGCLACKSCVGQCPIKVDVPAFRSRFLEVYYGRYLRPAKDRLVASLERWLPVAATMPRVVNGVTQSGLGRAALRRLGLVALPELSGVAFRGELERRGVRMASPAALMALPPHDKSNSLVIVQDAFTSHYDTAVVLDFCELLSQLGFTPWMAPFKPNGKPEHVLGFLGKFEQTAASNAGMLNALAATGVELVGIDPSMTLAYRAEYVKALGVDRVPRVALPQEWLAQRIDRLPQLALDGTEPWGLLAHCTEKTNAPAATAEWAKVGRRFGIDLNLMPSGCCGMAGLYGHELANRSNSEAIYKLSWANLMSNPRFAGRVVATGYSCRGQADLMDGIALLHPLQLLLARLKTETRPLKETRKKDLGSEVAKTSEGRFVPDRSAAGSEVPD